MRSCSCACKRASNLSIVLCRRLRPIWARDVGWRACGCQRTRGRVRSLWRFGQRTFLHDFVAQGLETHATEARRWPSHAQRVPKLPDLADPDGCRSPADMPPGQLRKKIFKTSEFVKNELNFFLFSSASTLTQQTLLLTAMSSTGYAPTGVCELASTHSCVLSICSQNNALLSRRCL